MSSLFPTDDAPTRPQAPRLRREIKKLKHRIGSVIALNGKTQKAYMEAVLNGPVEMVPELDAKVRREFEAITALELALDDLQTELAEATAPVTDAWLTRMNCSDAERAGFGFPPAAASAC